ncbi:hypothetical protein [Thermomicrobium sp.]
MAGKWHFQVARGIGLAPGVAVRDVLANTGMPSGELLAREVIQNSVDAADESSGQHAVRICFRFIEYDRSILSLLDMSKGSEFTKRIESAGFGDLGLHPLNAISPQGERPHKIRGLLIEDFGTRGLRGDPTDTSSDMHKLLFSVGNTDKDSAFGTGGSYGFGKSALAICSMLNTIICYTVYRSQNGLDKRLIGAAYLRKHKFAKDVWTGWAWFGAARSRKIQEDVSGPEPIEGSEAESLAVKLGFDSRSEDSAGTSILIFDLADDVTPESVMDGIEKWWWPRIEDGTLDVKVIDFQKRERIPEPRSREEVKHFVEAYRLALGLAEPAGDHQRAVRFNKSRNLELGRLALVRLPFEQLDDDHEEPKLLGRVALVRKPRMVVQYFEPRKQLDFGVVGVFVAADDIDRLLKLSEPPSHDRWDPRTQRVRSVQDWDAGKVVESVLARIKQQYRDFCQTARPPIDPTRRLVEFERLLGSMLKVAGGVPETGAQSQDPIHIRFARGPRTVIVGEGSAKFEGEVELELGDRAKIDAVSAVLSVDAFIAEEGSIEKFKSATGGGTQREAIPVTLICEEQEVLAENQIRIQLSKRHPIKVIFESGSFESEWSVQLRVRVEAGDDGLPKD